METNKNTLLIVDDENSNLKVLSYILGDDYTIYTATNGKNAIEKALELQPDLILLDILMPEMDGYQVLTQIKNNDETTKIPVIFITGLDSEEAEEKGLSLDAADYITKPFKAPIVKLRVRNQIQIINQLRTIEHLSMIDPLTNIPNRRSFDYRMNIVWKQAIREYSSLSLLMMDLDWFKKVNDKYGHQQGDLVLKIVACVLVRFLRRSIDFTARWGGEEFVMLLPNTPLESALEIAEKVRMDVENTPIPIIEKINPPEGSLDGFPDSSAMEMRITISIGVTSKTPMQDCSAEVFMSKADKALYIAKQSGRNKVMHVV